MGGTCRTYGGGEGREGERRGAYKVLVGKPEGKRPLGRTWRRWEDIKMVFMKWDEGAWSGLMWLRTPTDSGHL
jgi:hypothetical protein